MLFQSQFILQDSSLCLDTFIEKLYNFSARQTNRHTNHFQMKIGMDLPNKAGVWSIIQPRRFKLTGYDGMNERISPLRYYRDDMVHAAGLRKFILFYVQLTRDTILDDCCV